MDLSKLNGLVPAVVQDDSSNEVLMVGFMNDAALVRTRETGYVTFFSRSRQTLGHVATEPRVLRLGLPKDSLQEATIQLFARAGFSMRRPRAARACCQSPTSCTRSRASVA
jgi:hypothetical protein